MSCGIHEYSTVFLLFCLVVLSMSTKAISADMHVQITNEGRPYLDVPLGSSAYVNQFISEIIQQCLIELRVLSEICSTQPHAAFTTLIYGMFSKLPYLTCTTPNISSYLKILDGNLKFVLIPNLTGHPAPNNVDPRLLTLPAWFGGLGNLPINS